MKVKKTIMSALVAAGLAAGTALVASPAQAAMNNAYPVYFTSYAWCLTGKKVLEDEYSFADDVFVSKCFYDSKRGQYYRVVGYNL